MKITKKILNWFEPNTCSGGLGFITMIVPTAALMLVLMYLVITHGPWYYPFTRPVEHHPGICVPTPWGDYYMDEDDYRQAMYQQYMNNLKQRR